MEPRIQYAQTTDGVSIAFSITGEGPALIFMATPIASHVQLEWDTPLAAGYYKRWAANRQLVRFDTRGVGLSDRSVDDFSLEARMRDLEAVVSHLGAATFALAGNSHAGPLALAYAADNPEKVSHLILVDAFSRAADLMAISQVEAVMEVLSRDWEMFSENLAALAFGWGREEARGFGEFIRECVTQETAMKLYNAMSKVDVSEVLPRVQVPTLVIVHSDLATAPVDVVSRLASRIPKARLMIVKGRWADSTDQFINAVEEFLDEGGETAQATKSREEGAFRTILFTDVEGSTALTQRLGDSKARDLLREHEHMVREALKSHGGSEVKTMGDGFMASFSSATKALECAIAMQRAFAAHNESAEEPILVRVGLNAGEPIAEGEDLYGTTVNLAARIASQAKGGEILASEAVRQIVAGKKFPFSDLGETALRGFEDQVHIYQVSWRGT